jgi:hypothetical protein
MRTLRLDKLDRSACCADDCTLTADGFVAIELPNSFGKLTMRVGLCVEHLGELTDNRMTALSDKLSA